MKVMLVVDVILHLLVSLLLVTVYHNNTLRHCLHGYTTPYIQQKVSLD